MTIICGIQSIGVVTIAMKVLHNSSNMCIHDLRDNYVYTVALRHIRQIPYALQLLQRISLTMKHFNISMLAGLLHGV